MQNRESRLFLDDLPLPQIHDLEDFVLDTERYETMISKKTGRIRLDKITKNSLQRSELKYYESLLPYHHLKRKDWRKLIPLGTDITFPASKSVSSLEELTKDILKLYQLSHAHYALMKNYNLYLWDYFPYGCCGGSTRGLLGTFWMHGFFNAASAVHITDPDHTYPILPYHIEDIRVDCTVLIDPTSDQLGEQADGKLHRNFVAIKTGTRWNYEASGIFSGNMFPDCVLNLGTIKKNGMISKEGKINSDYGAYFKEGSDFLRRAYSNPIKSIPDIRIERKPFYDFKHFLSHFHL